ncbi:MAG: hypothetical protein H3C34_10195, partial [Caldilineaceae bacterium]|nr:hypothetical protein [Caldilineaceae bacterium]
QAVKAGLATNSVSAIVSSIRQKTESLRQAQAETAALQRQFDELAAARTELERELNARRDALAVLSREAETVQAEKNSLVDNLSLRAGELQDLQLRYSDLQGQYAQIAAERDSIQRQLTTREAELAELKVRLADMASWQEKTPAVAALGQSLANMSEAKLVAANASVAAHAMPYLVNEPQALTNIKGVGPVFAQRLYKNGVGTYWEVAVLTDDELTRHLQLNDLQLLHVDLASMRGAAKRLAEESHTVGAIWEGEPPDDFEPIKGIGKVYEQRLYDAGIRTYAALAALTPEQLAEICPAQRPLKPDYASWIEQARQYLQKQGQ